MRLRTVRALRWTDPTRARWITGAGLIGTVLFGPGLVDLTRQALMQWRMDRRLAELSAQREQLTHEEERLRTDPGYVEGLIRSTFKVAQPGEYVIPLDDAPTR